MRVSEQVKKEILSIFEEAFTLFLSGDFHKWAKYLTDDIQIIGTAEVEWLTGKQAVLDYFNLFGDQIAGKVKMELKEYEFMKIQDLVMLTTFSDGWVLLNGKWQEDAQWRGSYIYKKSGKYWICCYMHVSIPDLRIAEGESIPFAELQDQNRRLKLEVKKQTKHLEETIKELKKTQSQLVQQEKLASLGQLTAGIAHEIKNPLNFVNNFSEVSLEMVEEAREEVRQLTEDRGPGSEKKKSPFEGGAGAKAEVGDVTISANGGDLILEILDDIEANLRKIHEHGSRADSIVKSMLQHSRGGDGKPEPTQLNPLIKEYVNLAFHGMRAGKDPIDVDIDLHLDENVGEVPLVAEDFSRVILNLCNNAFDAMREKQGSGCKEQGSGEKSPFEGGSERSEQGDDSSLSYTPKLSVRTKSSNGKITIEIEDNGPGIPDEIKDKILQPFFTTKKGTQGTGLGLSITNDIVKAHGGQIEIDSDNSGTVFRIIIPV